MAYYEPGDVDELASCISRIYADPEKRNELARNSASFAKEFHWDQLKEELSKWLTISLNKCRSRSRKAGMKRIGRWRSSYRIDVDRPYGKQGFVRHVASRVSSDYFLPRMPGSALSR